MNKISVTIKPLISRPPIKLSMTVPGPKGEPGKDGTDGKSAYQLAVDNGFIGTEQEWLESLVGPQGPPGEITEEDLINYVGSLDNLTTEQKANIVAAVNELRDAHVEHKAEIMSQTIKATRDLSILGTQTITTGSGKKIQSISVFGRVGLTKFMTCGIWARQGTQYALYQDSTSQDIGSIDTVFMAFSSENTTNRVTAKVQNVQDGSFELLWEQKSGTALSGTANFFILIQYHQ